MMLMHDGAMKKILRAKRRRINQSTTVPCLLLLILLLGSYNQRDKLVDFIESSSSSDSFFAVRSSTTTAPSFRLALHESLGFFTDIPDDQWIRRKKLTLETVHHIKGEDFELAEKNPRNWYQHNWNPDFSCFFEKSIGDMGEGHKIVCDPHRLPPDCLVYSFGSNRQFGFELGLNGHAPQCEIHIFDYTDYSKNMRRQRVNATYHAWGLKPSYASNGTWSKKYPQTQPMGSIFKTFQETVAELGHEGRRIDILKLDVEGSEWSTYKDWALNPTYDIRQINVEVHEFVLVTNQFFQDLHDNGYVIFSKEPNIRWAQGDCVEYSFLKLHADSFTNIQ